MLADLDLARHDQGQPGTDLADSREHFPGLVAARHAKAAEPRQLIGREAQEHLRPARHERAHLLDVGHGRPASARKPNMASIVAFGCSSISQWPELGMLSARTLPAANSI